MIHIRLFQVRTRHPSHRRGGIFGYEAGGLVGFPDLFQILVVDFERFAQGA